MGDDDGEWVKMEINVDPNIPIVWTDGRDVHSWQIDPNKLYNFDTSDPTKIVVSLATEIPSAKVLQFPLNRDMGDS